MQKIEAAQAQSRFPPYSEARASCNAITGVALPRLNAMSSIRSRYNTASTLDPQGGYTICKEHMSVSLTHSSIPAPCKPGVPPS